MASSHVLDLIDRIQESLGRKLSSKEILTVEDVETFCPECAERMRSEHIKGLKLSALLKAAETVEEEPRDVQEQAFPGKKGERFDNCVKDMMDKKDIDKERATKLCAWIGRKWGKIK